VPSGRTGTSTTCSESTAMCHPRHDVALKALVRRRRRRDRGTHRWTSVPRRAPRRTHYRHDATPASSLGMPRGLLRCRPAARRRSQRERVGANPNGAARGDASVVGRAPGAAGSALPPPR
jgi:hypothetical protein